MKDFNTRTDMNYGTGNKYKGSSQGGGKKPEVYAGAKKVAGSNSKKKK